MISSSKIFRAEKNYNPLQCPLHKQQIFTLCISVTQLVYTSLTVSNLAAPINIMTINIKKYEHVIFFNLKLKLIDYYAVKIPSE